MISKLQVLIVMFFMAPCLMYSQSNNLDIEGVATIDGRLALSDNSNSVFIGVNAGLLDDGLNSNVFVGHLSGRSNTSGEGNTFIGRSAGFYNSIGEGNAFIGQFSGFNNTIGIFNTFQGQFSGFNNTEGFRNTFVGRSAGYFNSTGNYNTFIGMQAGNINTTGTNNLIIGYNADGSSATVSNEITLGNGSITTLRCNQTSITSLSDRRDKKDITEISEGIEFITQLKPVTFLWHQRDGGRVDIPAAGFIAQDLLALQQNSPIGEYLDLVATHNPEKLEARYNNLLPVMVKAIQEQQDVIESQESLIAAQGKKIAELESMVQGIITELATARAEEE